MHACRTMKITHSTPTWQHKLPRETNMPSVFFLTFTTTAFGRLPSESFSMTLPLRMSLKKVSSELHGGYEGSMTAVPFKHGSIGSAATRRVMPSGKNAPTMLNSNLRLSIKKLPAMAGMEMLRENGLFTSCSHCLPSRGRQLRWSFLRSAPTQKRPKGWDAQNRLSPGASILPNAGCANS